MKIYIKYMVSIRCKMFVEFELRNLGLHITNSTLGEVEVLEDISPNQLLLLAAKFSEVGLELLTNKKDILIEKIKVTLIDIFHNNHDLCMFNVSACIQDRLHYDYNYLSSIFSESIGMSIEQYIIAHKIESIKVLLSYNDLNLTEISYKLNYKNISHLSSQFKQITGQTPSFFKTLNEKRYLH